VKECYYHFFFGEKHLLLKNPSLICDHDPMKMEEMIVSQKVEASNSSEKGLKREDSQLRRFRGRKGQRTGLNSGHLNA